MDDPSVCLRFRRWWVWQILLDLERLELEMVATSQEDDCIIVDPAPVKLQQYGTTKTVDTANDPSFQLSTPSGKESQSVTTKVSSNHLLNSANGRKHHSDHSWERGAYLEEFFEESDRRRKRQTKVDIADDPDPDIHYAEADLHFNDVLGTAVCQDQMSIISLNVGPVGLRGSMHMFEQLFQRRPAVILLQDTKLTARGIQSCKAILKDMAPEYCLVPNSTKSPHHPFYVRTAIIIHRGWTHALGSLDAKNMQNGSSDPMVWENVQAVKHTDPHLGTTGLWLNVYSPISTDPTG